MTSPALSAQPVPGLPDPVPRHHVRPDPGPPRAGAGLHPCRGRRGEHLDEGAGEAGECGPAHRPRAGLEVRRRGADAQPGGAGAAEGLNLTDPEPHASPGALVYLPISVEFITRLTENFYASILYA